MQAQCSWYRVKNYFPGDSVTALAARSSNLKCYVQDVGLTEPHSYLRTTLDTLELKHKGNQPIITTQRPEGMAGFRE